MKEKWKWIPGFKGYYKISSSGRMVTYHNAPHGRLMDLTGRDNGYVRVSLHKNGITTRRGVHRLVILAFVGRHPNSDMEVCHNNGVRDDNRLKNLRWDTSKGNCADRVKHGTDPVGSRNPAAVLTEDQVRTMRRKRKNGITLRALCNEYSVGRTTVKQALYGVNWKNVDEQITATSTSKLTPAHAKKIRELFYGGKYTQAHLAKKFGVAAVTISSVIQNKSYKTAGGPDCSGKNKHVKMSWDKVNKLRHEYSTGEHSIASLAREYGIHSGTARDIIIGRIWNKTPRTDRRRKLTTDDVRVIRASRAAGSTVRIIAKSFDVDDDTIARVLKS